MKQIIWIFVIVALFFTSQVLADTMTIRASQGNINEIIEADTLANGSQAHNVYQLVTLDTTYKFTGALTIKEDMTIMGVLDPVTGRPPCIQPAVLMDLSIPPTLFIINVAGAKVTVENIYFLALATNNALNADGMVFSVTADEVSLTVDNCVFDAWQAFGIGYSGNWDSFYILNCNFRNFVHPNQWYIGEVIRNTWPGEAYTDTISMVGNSMLCINGYASAPVTKFYEKYFEFTDNKVLYTFKNPFFIFNMTEGKINNNIFYANYSGGVDTTENPWWDNLWEPDTSYGVIALQPLNGANAKMFQPEDSANAEYMRDIEVMDNVYFWPSAITDFWESWNSTQANWIRTPVFMNDRTVDMFADDETYPNLVASNNVEVDPGIMASLDDEILNGAGDLYNVGFLDYFEQIRTGTASTQVWGYKWTDLGFDPPLDWVPTWPLPEAQYITAIEEIAHTYLPSKFELSNIYPNPFNPSTHIDYTLNESGNISLVVYNLLGQQVKVLIDNQFRKAQSYSTAVDMSGFSSGIYFVVLKQGANTASRKMILLK